MVCATDGGATLHGIVSRGSGELGCAGAASVFVDVFEFVDQILQHLNMHRDNPCPLQRGYMNGWCDQVLNNPGNCFDGGDCCLKEHIKSDFSVNSKYFLLET